MSAALTFALVIGASTLTACGSVNHGDHAPITDPATTSASATTSMSTSAPTSAADASAMIKEAASYLHGTTYRATTLNEYLDDKKTLSATEDGLIDPVANYQYINYALTGGGAGAVIYAKTSGWIRGPVKFLSSQGVPDPQRIATQLGAKGWLTEDIGAGDTAAAAYDDVIPTGSVTVKPVAMINGVAVIPLVGANGELDVAATGKHVPVRAAGFFSNAGDVLFSDWGKAVPHNLPALADTYAPAS